MGKRMDAIKCYDENEMKCKIIWLAKKRIKSK